MDVQMAIGLAAAPAIISGVLGIINWAAFDRISAVADVKRTTALALGIGYGLLTWHAGLLEADNAVVAGLLGLTAGLGALGWRREVVDRVRSGS